MKKPVVLDLTSRLPGPLATSLLQELGIKVTKIEFDEFPDPFKNSNSIFKYWYKLLNQNKKIVTIKDVNSKNNSQLKKYIQKSNIILIGLPQSLKEKYQIEEIINNHPGPLAVIYLKGYEHNSNKHRPLHDLNALALSDLLKLHVSQFKKLKRIPPPFIPFAGISYAQNLSLHMLNLLFKSFMDGKIYKIHYSLEESTKKVSRFLKGTPAISMHNGAMPTYHIYPINHEGYYLALAFMEKKYWRQFLLWTKLALSEDDYLKKNKNIFLKLEKYIKSLNLNDAKLLCKKTECISLIKV